jgi:hypothetical protein
MPLYLVEIVKLLEANLARGGAIYDNSVGAVKLE